MNYPNYEVVYLSINGAYLYLVSNTHLLGHLYVKEHREE